MSLYNNYEEEWREISKFPNYLVSNYGRVKNYTSGKILKASFTGAGYSSVGLYDDFGCHTTYIHHLVADAFINKSRFGLEINHIDGDKTNNDVDNLEIVTGSENKRHAYKNQLRTPPIAAQRVRLIETGEEFDSMTLAGMRVNANRGSISNVVNGKSKTAKGFRFERI